jgi:RNA polymerase sigma-70 factor (ECF subfamily)
MPDTSASPRGPVASTLDDRAVVGRVLAGDREAYRLLVERHQRRIRAALWRLTGNTDEAEELTQAAFCRAYFALSGFNPQYEFGAWIYRIAHNLCINHIKRDRRELALDAILDKGDDEPAELGADEETTSPERQVAAGETAARVRAALAQLPDAFRDVLVMHFLLELSHEEIVAQTGVPLGTVKSRLSRARQHLAKVLAEMGGATGTREGPAL